jgi:hypothetical protein
MISGPEDAYPSSQSVTTAWMLIGVSALGSGAVHTVAIEQEDLQQPVSVLTVESVAD